MADRSPDFVDAMHGMPPQMLLLLSIRAGRGQITAGRLE
jgi:hypothetical protein